MRGAGPAQGFLVGDAREATEPASAMPVGLPGPPAMGEIGPGARSSKEGARGEGFLHHPGLVLGLTLHAPAPGKGLETWDLSRPN